MHVFTIVQRAMCFFDLKYCYMSTPILLWLKARIQTLSTVSSDTVKFCQSCAWINIIHTNSSFFLLFDIDRYYTKYFLSNSHQLINFWLISTAERLSQYCACIELPSRISLFLQEIIHNYYVWSVHANTKAELKVIW